MIIYADFLAAIIRATKSKPRSFSNANFARNIIVEATMLLTAIISRKFKATGNYVFLISVPKYREVFATGPATRAVHHYIEAKVRPLVEEELSDAVCNNRKGKGTRYAINRVWDKLRSGVPDDTYIGKIDIKGYFPSARWDIAENKLADLVERKYNGPDKDTLLYLLHECLYSNPAADAVRITPAKEWNKHIDPEKSLFNKPYGVGAAIGFLIWQLAMTYYLNDIDHYIENTWPELHYTRFVDDLVFIGPKKSILNAISMTRKMMKGLDLVLNEKKTYIQPWYNGLEYLGYHIRKNRIHLNKKTLARAEKAVIVMNERGNKESLADKFCCTCNSYLGLMNDSEKARFISLLTAEWNKHIQIFKTKVIPWKRKEEFWKLKSI